MRASVLTNMPARAPGANDTPAVRVEMAHIVRSPGVVAKRRRCGRGRRLRLLEHHTRPQAVRRQPVRGRVQPVVSDAISQQHGALVQYEGAVALRRCSAVDQLDHVIDAEAIEARHQIDVVRAMLEPPGLGRRPVAEKVGVRHFARPVESEHR